ncbi:MAG: protein tyrosine phosphatase [Proteobacteria bacterium]|nr:protein tyrosine phosphatase [Pseudomonadota bacterium]
MPRIHVCSLQRLHQVVRESGAADLVTVIKASRPVERPAEITPERHLMLNFSDITAPREGEVLAREADVAALIDWFGRWKREKPVVVHCYAGVSRSTASAYIAACLLRPERSEVDWAQDLREASPTATPNIHLVRLADGLLGRGGRMVSAIEAIGRGADCFEGVPFSLDIGRWNGRAD